MICKFSHDTIAALGQYVYVYSDPDTKKPFYVGKGTGNRVFSHLKDNSDTDKVRKIKEIRKRGKEPLIEILAHGLDDETALKVEAAAIDLIGIDNLTNIQRGYESGEYGKIEVSLLDARYKCEKLYEDDINDNIMMIRINKLYRNDMSDHELYEATRGYWHASIDEASKVDYVLSVYDGMVLEAYEPIDWFYAGSTFMEREDAATGMINEDRIEFVGRVADEKTRRKYVGKSVNEFFKQGQANPIHYIWGR